MIDGLNGGVMVKMVEGWTDLENLMEKAERLNCLRVP